MTRKIALFEPWGLGDLAISLGLARTAAEQGYAVVLFCDPKYVEWARTFTFLSEVKGITVPWTRKRGKYSFRSYPWREWRSLHGTFEFVLEPRRDPRAALLLKFLFRSPLRRPVSKAGGLGYGRASLLAPPKARAFAPTVSVSLVCFFGAEWANRRMPTWKIPELLASIRETLPVGSGRIGVIVPLDEAETSFYRDLEKFGVDRVAGSISEVATRLREYSHCLSTDSGWLHVAHLEGLRTLGLFAFANDQEWMPPQAPRLLPEHVLPGDARYTPACEALQPLGTLRREAFCTALQTFFAVR